MRYEIVMDHGETGNKCTLAPVANRPDFKIFPVFGEGLIGPLSGQLILHHEGECLSQLDLSTAPSSIVSVDCVWRRLPKILRKLSWIEKPARAVKIPRGFVTSYPRVGQYEPDPEGGLATIEAIFIATALMGKWDVSLLSRYYFARKFVERNAELFVNLGVREASDKALWPPEKPLVRNSNLRRINRGRAPVSG